MNTSPRWRILAPGKLVLMGEYSVVDGAVAVVMAVDRWVSVGWGDSTPLGLVAFARAETARRLGVKVAQDDFAADSSELHAGAVKLGLGSSAAVTVGAVGSVFYEAGLDLEQGDIRTRLWDVAHEIHDGFQGKGGSGIDIAASIHGGFTMMRHNGPGVARSFTPWTPPEGIVWVPVWTGIEASTPSFLDAVRGFRTRDPDRYATLMAEMTGVSERFANVGCIARSIGPGSTTVLLDTIHQYSELMTDLGRFCGTPIVSEPMARVVAAARETGGAAKPSGAGGGDFMIAAFPVEGDVETFQRRVRREGMVPMDLGVGGRGVHVWRPIQ